MENHLAVSNLENLPMGMFSEKGVTKNSEEGKRQEANYATPFDPYSEKEQEGKKRNSRQGWSDPYNEWY